MGKHSAAYTAERRRAMLEGLTMIALGIVIAVLAIVVLTGCANTSKPSVKGCEQAVEKIVTDAYAQDPTLSNLPDSQNVPQCEGLTDAEQNRVAQDLTAWMFQLMLTGNADA